jgi:hypothetical protein
MIEYIISSVFFEVIGAFIKWSVYAFFHKIRGKRIVSFKEMWRGRRGSNKSEIIMHGASNVIIGILIVLLLLLILNKFYIRYS